MWAQVIDLRLAVVVGQQAVARDRQRGTHAYAARAGDIRYQEITRTILGLELIQQHLARRLLAYRANPSTQPLIELRPKIAIGQRRIGPIDRALLGWKVEQPLIAH